MKLTKSQRHVAYIIMLAEIELAEFDRSCFCILSYDLFGFDIQDKAGGVLSIEHYYPELAKRKPAQPFDEAYWFHPTKGLNERIVLLKQCIIETY